MSTMIGRVIRRVAAIVLRAAFLHPRTTLAATVLFVTALGSVWMMSRILAPPESSTGPSTAAAAPREVSRTEGTGVPVPAVESYIRGMTTFDAKLMWDALNEDAKRQMQAQGDSVEGIQQVLNRAKQTGVSYDESAFIGSYPRQDGSKYVFYVISRRGLDPASQVEQIWFVFTVDPTGKIAKID